MFPEKLKELVFEKELGEFFEIIFGMIKKSWF
jgi:hypothetical protein